MDSVVIVKNKLRVTLWIIELIFTTVSREPGGWVSLDEVIQLLTCDVVVHRVFSFVAVNVDGCCVASLVVTYQAIERVLALV